MGGESITLLSQQYHAGRPISITSRSRPTRDTIEVHRNLPSTTLMNTKPAHRTARHAATAQEEEMWKLLSGQKLRTMQNLVQHRVATRVNSDTSEIMTIELMMRPA